MKQNFKYIVLGIITCLIVVFIWQLIWLKGLYNSIKADTEQTILECLERTNLDELQMRMDSLDRSPKKGSTISITQTLNDDEDKEKDKKGLKKTKKIINKNDTTTSVTDASEDNSLTIDLLQKLVFSLTETIHQTIDSVAPANLNVADSILSVHFAEKGIKSKIYSIGIINLNDNKVRHQLVNDSLSLSQSETFNFTFDTEKNQAYVIHVESLTRTVLTQMWGILGTTLLIILILGFAFWYLIRTVIQQRTLEEMKDDFTNNMTHELKTPIAVAYSAADALLNFKQGEDKEMRYRYLSICKDRLEELSASVEQILSMSMERRQTFALNKEEIQLHPLIGMLIEQHKLKAGKQVQFSLAISPQDLTVTADRTHFSNIISNLIDNAIKYSHKEVDIAISVRKDTNNCILSITDNGIGIAPEKQKYIFEKFYRVTSGNRYSVKGYGLGLFYVKTMIEKHNGEITVQSTPQKGTTFTIIIPIR